MTNFTTLDAYKIHDLNITMKTSSGDVINIDLSSKQALSVTHEADDQKSSELLSFSSEQNFNFSIKTNGIDAQDKKEIDGFMKVAQPYIDNFMQDLENKQPTAPMNQVAKQVTNIFSPIKTADKDTQNYTQKSIVDLFDNAAKNVKDIGTIFDDAKSLLTKILDDFNGSVKALYA